MIFAIAAALTVAAQEKPKSEAQEKTESPRAEKTGVVANALPTVDDIIEKQIKAIGGKEAIEKITSRSMNGSINIETLGVSDAPVEIIAKASNKYATKISITGIGEVTQVFDGSKGWSSDPMGGLRELSGVELAQMKRDADFLLGTQLQKELRQDGSQGQGEVRFLRSLRDRSHSSRRKPGKALFRRQDKLARSPRLGVRNPGRENLK
ncbi:MAG: hypothetical protein J2P21_30975 [Chloracidobacterium sp.]|nr:hypothetical protein [Chloracidobacterium sp.]